MISIIQLQEKLKTLRASDATWGEIVQIVCPDLADKNGIRPLLYKIAYLDYTPKDNEVREKLGLPMVKEVEGCLDCGGLHVLGECTQGKRVIVRDKPTPRKPRNRRAINLSDPESAARTIAAHSDDFYRNELIQHLLKTIGE